MAIPSLLEYIMVFIIFSVLGWAYECILKKKRFYNTHIKKYLNINLPMMHIYGIGAVILYYVAKNFKDCSLLYKILLASLLINTMECMGGLISYQMHGFYTWNYNNKFMPLCCGYVSLTTAVWWTLLIAIIMYGFDRYI